MVRIILAAVAGFIAWSIMWIGSDQVLMTAMPDWYGAHQLAFEKATKNNDPFTAETTILVMHLVRSILITIMSGFLAAVIAGENRRSPLILGVLLLLFGIAIQGMYWNYLPVWYHLIFLALLIPMAIVGGKLKSSPAVSA
ncbi:MAG: hypothetical protein QUS14_14420 [Pyrinomonadaceae bacterium]|nr:hypothetical protein [Pyrinomonadaceae bacterium]